MKTLTSAALLILLVPAFAADNLRLNSKLDYSSDSQDGPLITGDHLADGFTAGKPAYVILYGEGCYNSKRQARRTVNLYQKYKGRVQFIIVDLDRPLSAAQQDLKKKVLQRLHPARGCPGRERGRRLQLLRRGGGRRNFWSVRSSAALALGFAQSLDLQFSR
jgi:hypothetical protein